MDSGVLLNNHDELSAALRNIRKTDSDGEEIEDDSEEESGEESADESDNDGEILNPQVRFLVEFTCVYPLTSRNSILIAKLMIESPRVKSQLPKRQNCLRSMTRSRSNLWRRVSWSHFWQWYRRREMQFWEVTNFFESRSAIEVIKRNATLLSIFVEK